MPLVKEDLRQIEELFEELLAKKYASASPFEKRGGNASVSFLSEREIFERILNVELELKNQRDLIEKILHQIDKRFEQVDKRFEELREDMNKRFEQVDKRFSQLFWFIGLFIPLCNSMLFLALSYVLK